jgi:hypothetical protein
MNQDDIEYVLELLEDAISSQDWDLIEEAQQYLTDFTKNGKKSVKYDDEE